MQCPAYPNATPAALLLILLFCSTLACLLVRRMWRRRVVPHLFGAAASRVVGNYGFLSLHFDNGPMLVGLVGEMMDELGVTDVQFYDWFPNYSGRYQAFQKVSGRTKGVLDRVPTAQPAWWKTASASWQDPWNFGTEYSRTIVAKDLAAAVAAVRSKGGRAWAYVQSQGSEFYNLAGEALECGDSAAGPETPTWASASGVLNPQTVSTRPGGPTSPPEHWDKDWQIFKIKEEVGGDWRWKCQGDAPGRVIPSYFLNGALAAYQCSAWAEPVRAFNFSGIHWDTMITPPAGATAPAWRDGAKAFVETSAACLAKQGLLQTFNDISLKFGVTVDSDNFGSEGSLMFPYSEIWTHTEEEAFYAGIDPGAGAVIAHYPGTSKNGCCSIAKRLSCAAPLRKCAEGCECSQTCDGDSYANCPLAQGSVYWTQEDLVYARYKEALCKGARYLIVGNGKERLITAYFPDTWPLSSGNYSFIKANPYGYPSSLCSGGGRAR